MNNTRIAMLLTAGILAGCASYDADKSSQSVSRPTAAKAYYPPGATLSYSTTIDNYKRELAERIAQANSIRVYSGRPQALLRSVVVVKYAVDSQGNLTHSEIMRSNRDDMTEAIALTSLRQAAPFPVPASHLLRSGRVEVSETWLFNNDGRFQLRSIAKPQLDE